MSQPSHSRSQSPVHSIDAEMHELNHEADYLEEKTLIVAHGPNGRDVKLQRHNSDPDAQAMVIGSLKAQVQDLFSQVSQLNGKLVKSYDRMSDLEDELHVTTANLRGATLKVGELELERTQHLAALSSGLLVEKDHVTAELNRLMEKATEEAAQRGQAESARAQIETELDDLSAGLFNQANNMVAEARIAQAKSERKVEHTERALREAEEVVGLLQTQMQQLQAEKERADRRVEEMRVTVGKGKWVERVQDSHPTIPRLLSLHAPYQEYLAFITHLRSIRPATLHPPAMSTLIPLPFLARLVTEDSDPTVRLDLAPSLNWLSRRSVISAIHGGELSIEPMPTIALLQELNPSSIPGQPHNMHVNCALCGTAIISPSSASGSSSPVGATFPSPPSHRSTLNNTWSSSIFKSSLVHTLSSTPSSLGHSGNQPPVRCVPTQIYIFRIATTTSGLPVSLPLSPQNNAQTKPTIYPLCTTRWCLARLRTTCSMWAYIRTGIVEKVWEDGVYVPPASLRASPAAVNVAKYDGLNGVMDADRKPPIPPRRSRMGIGALWGSVQRSLSGREMEVATDQERVEKPLPGSPKTHPVPPPLHPPIYAPTPNHPPTTPPPLPPRSRGRDAAAKPVAPAERFSASANQGEPPLLARLTSSGDYSTPPEELPAFVSPDPTAVPLPPTAPSTPEPQHSQSGETAPAAQSDQPQDLPSADEQKPVAAPSPIPAVAAANLQEHPGSRSGSPVPPPLPRRAAARLRPVSVVVPVAEPITVENTGVEQAAPVSDTPTQPIDATGVAAHTESTDATKPPDSSAVDAPVGSLTESTGAGAVEAHTALVTAAPEEAPQADVDASVKLRNGVDPDTIPPSPVAPSTNGVVDGVKGQSLHLADIRSSPEPEANAEIEDPALYVGDGTWEERTWKELTRLREDMFWARVGGVR